MTNNIGTSLEKNKQPWEMNKSLVNVIKAYGSKITGELKDGKYSVDFTDFDGTIVEAELEKEKFDVLPYSVGEGTRFWIVFYKLKEREEIKATTWPVAKYWHESWRKAGEDLSKEIK